MSEYRTADRTRSLVLCALMGLWGLVSLVRVLAAGQVSGFIDAFGLGWLVIIPFLLNVSLAKVVVDDQGIRARRPLWRRTYRWREISAVTTELKTSRGFGAHRVRIHRRSGRPRWLPAPYVDMRSSDRQLSEFEAQVQQITERWRAAGGEGER
ncbi:PH domain-containing protein [Streptomyces sp. NPDC006879]|uniref:PH domain-containing protein n=1 Tax=Streptomyces sp. NPDC006879 TaxID=3364767 RepID=UPI0036ABC061